ncbi:serine/threonine-protein kinase [Roseisolibacter sp. H3M3-2]|uniref:serine/threonine-protein kinase n=1 Tax=Roseisolibacter sp. H3M3-2 TaxID=3031323 RepID=UPI0023DBC87B|nr:serine/threonine-protein kinase [Roseisolibacter sp. H3M3-2]MDF1505581.1 protein kinase [Roseisolibacter sp. H3M3-2]
MDPFPPDDVLGAQVADALRDAFTLERELGRGGMGVVYLARDRRLDRPVALKVLPPPLARQPDVRERFLREARTAAKLSHPHIVPVYRADEAEGLAYFTMAFVEGESLGDRVRDRGPLAAGEAVRILREVAWALAYAHARGVVHRDIKPENILLERPVHGGGPGRALVSDFGIARLADGVAAGDGSERLTLEGHVLGTLHFMSPEQVQGGPLDGRSDLYALGVVAYHALSGRLPFEELRGPAVLVAHATRPAPPLRSVAPGVPAALAAAVDRCLEKAPDARWPTGEALAEALERAVEDAGARDAAPALPDGLPDVVSEAEAAAIWQRAAQLQADALRRLEERRDLMRQQAALAPADGYRLADVAGAAEEAGISRQYVAMALAELPRGATAVAPAPMGIGERQATFFLKARERSLGVSHVVAAPPARTLRALGAVLPRAPYELQLRDTVGAHPLDGGVLVFDLPGPVLLMPSPMDQFNKYWLNTHHALEATQLQVTLRALPGDPGRTEVTMTCDLRPGVRRNVRASQVIAGGVGSFGGAITGAALAKGGAVAASAAVSALGAAVGEGLGALSLAWYRWLYPSVLRKARAEMQRALQAVGASVQAEAVFGAPPPPPALPRAAGEQTTASVLRL